MFGLEINLLAIFVVTLISFALGLLWFGPLFGKHWIKLSKIPASEIAKAKQKSMTKPMILNLIGNLITAYILSNFINILGISVAIQGIILGFWIWLGFLACTTLLNSVLWDGKPWDLFVLNGLYWLVDLMLAGLILAVWR